MTDQPNDGPARKEPITDDWSLRDWFAGQVAASMMGGLLSANVQTDADAAPALAQVAYIMADAMLAEKVKK